MTHGAAAGPMLRGLGWLHATVASRRRAERLADTLAAHLGGCRTILDVGCGDGRLAGRLRRRLPGTTVIGVDVRAVPGAPVPVARYDGDRLPFPPGSVDAVMLVDVLHHAEDPRRTLDEAVRVSRATVVVKDHLRCGPWSAMVLAFMDWFGNRPHGVRLVYRYLALAEWRALFGELGLGVEQLTVGLELYPKPFAVLFRPEWQFVARLRVAERRPC